MSLSSLELTLRFPADLRLSSYEVYSLGPFLQGVLMREVDSDYAEALHHLPFNPYSQYCTPIDQGLALWRISALNDEAYRQIILPMMACESFELESLNGTHIEVSERKLESHDQKELSNLIVAEGSSKFKVRFLTPTAFKSAGRYVFMPSIRLVYQNLLMRYLYIYEGDKEADDDTVPYIDQHARVTSYQLRSEYFKHVSANGRPIPAFMGSMTINCKGPQQLSGLCRMLLRFGEYAGVGIKTSMGMGGIQCLQRE